jgi:hypothetical protein
LDDDTQDLLDNIEYTTDVEVSEGYAESAKRTLFDTKEEMENRRVSTGEKPNYCRLTGWKGRIEKLKAREEMLEKLDADMKICGEEGVASHREMVAEIRPETPEETMTCQEMEEAESEERHSCEVSNEREHREKEMNRQRIWKCPE